MSEASTEGGVSSLFGGFSTLKRVGMSEAILAKGLGVPVLTGFSTLKRVGMSEAV